MIDKILEFALRRRGFVVLAAGWNDAEAAERSAKGYFALILAVEGLAVAVFAATDLFLFYVAFEATLIPLYFLIGGFGREGRRRAAVKFLIYSLVGGLVVAMRVAVSGRADDKLLDTYDVERRKHARAMIDLSTMVGRVISPTNRRVATARDLLVRSASIVPSLKRYVLEMRFKPMPRYEHGAVVHAAPGRTDSPVGTLFVQPRVDTREQQNVLLDDVLGSWFAVLCWNNNPRKILGDVAFANWKALGARFFALRPATQLHWTGHDDPDVVVVGDRHDGLKSWFDTHSDSVLFLRPDRYIAGACIAQRAPDLSAALLDTLTLTPRGGDLQSGTGSVLYVAQPSPESSGAVAGPA